MPNFEVFTKSMAALAQEPTLTIQKSGVISLNPPAYEALGSPAKVVLMFDRESRVIGIRAADDNDENGYLIWPNSGPGKTMQVSAGKFVQYYGIGGNVARRWPGALSDGVLVVDISKEPKVTTRRRAASSP